MYYTKILLKVLNIQQVIQTIHMYQSTTESNDESNDQVLILYQGTTNHYTALVATAKSTNVTFRFLTTTLTKFLKIIQSSCDAEGFQEIMKLVTDILKNSEDYDLPLEGACLTDVEAELEKRFQY